VLVITAPGQGAQTPGFLSPWLEVPGVAERLAGWSELAECDLIRYGTTGSEEEIKDTAVAQPLLVAAALVPIYGMSRSSFWLLLLGPFVAFFGTGFFSGYAAIASEIFPGEIRAAAMGLSYNIGRGFSAIAPFAVGALALKYGIGPAFFLQAGAFFVAAMLALLLPETRGRQLT